MNKEVLLKRDKLFEKIRLISNRLRFKILELTENKELTISELSSRLGLAYTKCADYVTLLEKENLVKKEKNGKEVKVKSKVKFEQDKILF